MSLCLLEARGKPIICHIHEEVGLPTQEMLDGNKQNTAAKLLQLRYPGLG